MTAELTALALAGILQALQFSSYAIAANRQAGTEHALGPRDTKFDLQGKAGRLQRALNNHFEALIMFTLAVVVVTLGDAASSFSATCAWVYLGARILYVPAYFFGLMPWRSLIWFVGFLSTMLMIISALI